VSKTFRDRIPKAEKLKHRQDRGFKKGKSEKNLHRQIEDIIEEDEELWAEEELEELDHAREKK